MSFRISTLVMLAIVVTSRSSLAAEDDVVVDGTVQVTIQTPVPLAGNVVRVIKDGKAAFLFTPDDHSGDSAIFEHQLTVFLKRVNAACSLNDEQMQKLKLAGKRDIQRFTQKPEPIELVQEMVNGRNVFRLPDKFRGARLATGTDFITVESLVYKVLKTQLTAEQKLKFEALQRDWNPINRNFVK